MNERKIKEHIDETEFAKALSMIRGIPPENQMFAIAFLNGMEFQKSISEAESSPVLGRRKEQQYDGISQ